MHVSIEPLEHRNHFAAGTLDPSFGNAGTATLVGLPLSADHPAATSPTQLRVDASGRTVVMSTSNGVINLTRLTPDGVVDPRFAVGTGGTITLSSETLNAVVGPAKLAVDGNNRIYVLLNDVLSRYLSSGKLDRTFADRGHLAPDANSDAYLVSDFTLAQDGSIYVNGEAAFDDGTGNMAITRYTPAGALDRTFADNGIYAARGVPIHATFDEGTPVENVTGDFIRTLTDGSIVAAGNVTINELITLGGDPGFALRQSGVQTVKFRPNGRVDKTYGRNGVSGYTLNSSSSAEQFAAPVGIRSDGAVLIYNDTASAAPNNFTLDAAGHYSGVVNFGPALKQGQFVRQSEGREIVVDTANKTLIRVNDDDSIDTTFNNGDPIGGVSAATVGGDGSIIFAGTGRSKTDAKFVVRRVFGSEGPAGRLVPTTLIAPLKYLPFRVVWRDDDGVDPESLDGMELRILLPGGTYARAALNGKTTSNGVVIADYTWRPGRAITAADNGTYIVRLRGEQVKDTNGVAAEARTLGAIVVAIA